MNHRNIFFIVKKSKQTPPKPGITRQSSFGIQGLVSCEEIRGVESLYCACIEFGDTEAKIELEFYRIDVNDSTCQ